MPEPVPAAVLEVFAALRRAGFDAWLVGGCVRDRLRGAPLKDWDVATSADTSAILESIPRAIPIGGVHGTAMVATAAGPVELTPLRANSLAGDLARRDFTINALALDPLRAQLFDPCGGQRDLERGVLRACGEARRRLDEDPLRALRAARLVAELALRPDDELRATLPAFAPALARVAAERVRAELDRLLAAPLAARGVTLLRETGLEAVLFPFASADAAILIERLPAGDDLRLSAWLRGTRSAALLARWRFPKQRAAEVERVLLLHPVDASLRTNEAAVRRLRKRSRGAKILERALTLRRAELGGGDDASEAHAALDALAAAIARVRHHPLRVSDLALNGREVGAVLGIPPGPRIGQALRFLAECVLEDPARNNPENLRALLREWKPEDKR